MKLFEYAFKTICFFYLGKFRIFPTLTFLKLNFYLVIRFWKRECDDFPLYVPRRSWPFVLTFRDFLWTFVKFFRPEMLTNGHETYRNSQKWSGTLGDRKCSRFRWRKVWNVYKIKLTLTLQSESSMLRKIEQSKKIVFFSIRIFE